MRVIAGQLGGRTFAAPNGHRTHPMSEKMRGAIFNVFGDINGLTMLDAFTGSGAIAIEAVSRGARHVTAIDVDKQAYETTRANVIALDLTDKIIVLRKNVGGWSRNNSQLTFDIIVADPPYDDIRPTLLERFIPLLKPHGIYVLSWPGSEPPRAFRGADIVHHKSYGDSQLVFYRRHTVK